VYPVEDVHELTLTWAFPPMEDKYLQKPLTYLGWVIGHEGNSFSKLKSFKIKL